MLKMKIKAFIKYKNYRSYILNRLLNNKLNIGVIKIVMICVLIVFVINSRPLKNFRQINQVNVESIFSLEKFLLKNMNNKSNEVALEQQNIKSELVKNINIESKEIKEIKEEISLEEKYIEVINEINKLKAENQKLKDDNINLQNLLKIAASQGIKPRNYRIAPPVVSRSGVLRGEYLGEFIVTAYTPSKIECGNDRGITYSGHAIVPGVTVAVDTSYWPIGSIFYIKGLGYVTAMDTGSAIKGKNRMDFAVFDREFAKKIGRRKFEVYLIKKGNGKVEQIEF